MTRFNRIAKTAAMFTLVLFVSSPAWAHSTHDHSTIPFKWEFSNGVKAKIDRSLQMKEAAGTIGLNKFEQRKLNHYGIKVYNQFKTHYRGLVMEVERNTMGLRIISVTDMDHAAAMETIPVRTIAGAVRMSMGHSHPGHDHAKLDVEWIFGAKTHDLIRNNLDRFSGQSLIGLSTFEQNLLEQYGIKVGNEFQSRIGDIPVTVTRTTAGIALKKQLEDNQVAKRPVSSNPDRF